MMRPLFALQAERDQFVPVARATPIAMIGYAINALLAVTAFSGRIPDTQLLLWGLFALTISGFVGMRSLRPYMRKTDDVLDEIEQPRSMRRAVLFSILLALPWTALGTLWSSPFQADAQVIAMTLIVGMAASGSILLVPLPAAAAVYVSTILIPIAINLLFLNGEHPNILLGGLACTFLCVLLVVIATSARLFIDRMNAIHRLRAMVLDLSKAREATERAAEAKSDFLATMSHEIRTPLNSIVGYADLMMSRNKVEAEDKSDLTVIRDAGKSLLAVVNDILDFSAIESGHLKLVPTPIRLGDIIHSSISIVAVAARDKGLTLRSEASGDVSRRAVLVDGQRIRQVLLNLLYNAVKFTQTGEVVVRMEAVSDADDHVRVRIEVADTGSGISASAIPSLFVRFSQLDNGRQRRFGGSGLGLAICKNIIAASGGTIGVESEVGKGSVFWFELPTRYTDDAVTSDAVVQTDPRRSRRLKVLIVDDIEANRRLTAALLARAGHEVKLAASGPDAVRTMEHDRYDVVLMDVQMPGMDGVAATCAIKGLNGPSRDVPIVAMTANVTEDEIARCHAAGMVAHLGKPFEVGDLLRTVEDVAADADTAADAAILIADAVAKAVDKTSKASKFRNDLLAAKQAKG